MKRLGCLWSLAALLVTLPTFLITAAGRFDQKHSPERQVIHVLNRLTFGPRPGDVEQVRKLTVEKWIDLQLHPDRISENPVLENKLTRSCPEQRKDLVRTKLRSGSKSHLKPTCHLAARAAA